MKCYLSFFTCIDDFGTNYFSAMSLRYLPEKIVIEKNSLFKCVLGVYLHIGDPFHSKCDDYLLVYSAF